MEIKQLQRFLAVVENGSLARAARALGLTQQALGVTISNLEREMDVILLDRGPGGVTRPTAYGAMLVRHAKAILSAADRAVDDLHAFRDSRSGQVVVGCGESFAPEIVAEAVSRLRADRPDVSITLLEGYSEDLHARMLHGEIDFVAGADVGGASEELLRLPIYSCRDVVVVRAEHPLAGRRNLTLSDLQPYAWMAPAARPSDHEAIVEAFRRSGLQPPTRFVFSDAFNVGLHLIMRENYMFMISPAFIEGPLVERYDVLVKLDIDEPTVERRASLTYTRNTELNPTALLLIEEIRSAAFRRLSDMDYAVALDQGGPLWEAA